MWFTLDAGTDGLRRGLLPLTAVLSTAIILAAMLPGPVRVFAAVRPLIWLGGLSYGLYLIHWPVLVALRHVAPRRRCSRSPSPSGSPSPSPGSARWLVELPVRRRQLDPSFVGLGAGALALVLLVALVLPAQTPASQALLDRISAAAAAAAPPSVAPAAGTAPAGAASPTVAPAGSPTTVVPATQTALGERPHIELLGDSIAFSLALATAPCAGPGAVRGRARRVRDRVRGRPEHRGLGPRRVTVRPADGPLGRRRRRPPDRRRHRRIVPMGAGEPTPTGRVVEALARRPGVRRLRARDVPERRPEAAGGRCRQGALDPLSPG